MTRYVTEADLTFSLGSKDPETGERTVIRKVSGLSLENEFPLPWPMTPVGAKLYVLSGLLASFVAIVAAIWVGFTIFEPSMLRLLPAVVVALAIRFLIVPALFAYGRRSGMDRRESEGE